jgi:hypothetical protein
MTILKHALATAHRLTLPTLASLYRNRGGTAPVWLLHAIGIADPAYRRDFYTLARIIDSTERFEGNIIECGVYKGNTLLGMAHRLLRRGITDVRLLGCDSFEGFPQPSGEDALSGGSFHQRARKGVFSDTTYERTMRKVRLLGFDAQVSLLKGFFDRTLPTLSAMRFSLAHLDCDLYRSYVTCLEFLYPRMVPGGYIVFDEYSSEDIYPGAKKAVEQFLAGKPEPIERFPDTWDPRYFIRKLPYHTAEPTRTGVRRA